MSSIHRAKGLEFDDVFIGEQGRRFEDEDVAEEARILYVGLTRARENLTMWGQRSRDALTKSKGPEGRWEWRGWGGENWKRLGLEFLGTDVDAEMPAVGLTGMKADAESLHLYLIKEVRRGDAVGLRAHPIVGEPPCTYNIIHGPLEVVIGRTSVLFMKTMTYFLRHRGAPVPSDYPPEIQGLHVEMLESVAGTSADAVRYGLGPACALAAAQASGAREIRLEQLGDLLVQSSRVAKNATAFVGSSLIRS